MYSPSQSYTCYRGGKVSSEQEQQKEPALYSPFRLWYAQGRPKGTLADDQQLFSTVDKECHDTGSAHQFPSPRVFCSQAKLYNHIANYQ